MRDKQQDAGTEILLVISGDSGFLGQVQDEFERRHRQLCIATVSSIEGARRVLEVRPPAAILLEDGCLESDLTGQNGRKPTLWAAVTSLAESAPVVVIGGAEHQPELTALLASGVADYVTRSEFSVSIAVGVVERRLRQLQNRGQANAQKVRACREEAAQADGENRDFGALLRHELNNPLTGILGNAELLLVEVRRKNIELPPNGESRLQTIATLAVRMRETVRKLSEEWESNAEKRERELAGRPV